MDWLRIVSLYLSDADCAAMRMVAPNSVTADRWQLVLSHAHKRHMAPIFAEVKKILHGLPHEYSLSSRQSESVSVYCKRLGRSVIASWIKYHAPYPDCTMFMRWRCEIEGCKRSVEIRNSGGLWEQFMSGIRKFHVYRSPSNNYQLVHLVDGGHCCTAILSSLLPCEMLSYDTSCKIVDSYDEFRCD
jgi:hypothetical protein